MATLSTSNNNAQEPLDDRLRRIPPFQAVFEAGGPPSSSALHLYLASLDNRLEENSRHLDSCLQGLLRFTNDLPGERTFSSPKDGLCHMFNSHVLEKDSCYDPEIEEAVIILEDLLQRLEQEPGSEEDVLQEVLVLASTEGLMLPLRMSALEMPDQAVASTASLHAIMDSSDQIIEQRWNKLAGRLKMYLGEQLSLLPRAVPGKGCSTFCLDRRMELVESLRVLCPDSTVWLKYKALRAQQLEDIFATLMPEVEEEEVSYKDFAKNCGPVVDSVIAMIDEDFVILNSGMFRKVTGVFKALHELYLEKFSDEMSLLLDEIGDEVAKNSQRMFTQSTSEHGLHKNNVMSGSSSSKSKDFLHRNSVGGLSNTKEGVVMGARTQAQSLDSMFAASGATSTANSTNSSAAAGSGGGGGGGDRSSSKHQQAGKRGSAFPEDCMQALLHIVLALMRLEDHIDSLMRCVTWDITGLPPKKPRKRSSIKGVLKPTASPETARYTPHSLQGQQSNSFSSSDTALDMWLNSPHGDMAAAPKVVEHSGVEERFRWEWKLVFKKLSGELSQAVEGQMLDLMQSCLAAESALWDNQHLIKTVPVDPALHGGSKVHYPKVTSLGSHQFLELSNRLLPLARVGCDGCLTPVRASFIDTVCICLKNFHVQLVKMSKDIPSQAPLKQLYVILATCGMIRNHLTHYDNLLTSDDGGKKQFSTLLRQYSELMDALMKHTVQLHSQTVATSILMDADSNDWVNIKDFYEDERCSFTVQMWNFHLRGLRYDLWTTCPASLAQSVFSSVLQDSLLSLMQRYVRVQPSFRRIKQFRYDITAMMLVMWDQLLWACNSSSRLLDPGHGQLPHYSIHNLCSNLLATLAVGASSLDILHRVFRRGFAAQLEELNGQEGAHHCGNTQWMHFFWPALLSSGGHKHYDDMQTSSALYLQLTLLLRQPQPNWGMLIQALVMKEQSLAVTLLTRSLMIASSHHSHSESLDSANGEDGGGGSTTTPRPPRLSAGRGQQEQPSTVVANARNVVSALIGVLVHAHPQFPSALSKCVLAAVERCDEWELFNVKTTAPELTPPLWMEALFRILDPLLEKIMEPMVFFLLKEKSPECERDGGLFSRLQDLPCGCQSNAANLAATWPSSHHSVPAKDLVRRCLELLIESTQQNMHSISGPVCILFHTLQAACTQRNIKTPHSCVGIQVLAWGMWRKLKDAEGMQTMVGLPLLPHHLSHLSMLADFYYQIMVFGKAKAGGTPKLASKFHKTHKEWLPHKVETITKFLSNDMFSEPESDILEGSTSVFADQVSTEVAGVVMATPSGPRDLRLLYNLVLNNSQWLFQQLNIPPPLPLPQGKDGGTGGEGGRSLRFCMQLTPPLEESFVPAVEYDRIGACLFDQDAIANFSLDWSAMLSSDLGLSEPSFLSLLRNRHEMHPGAVLDHTEKKMVDALRTACNL